MACMYNSEHHQNSSLIGPRISFSNDFVVDSSGPSVKHERPELDPSAPDFEFSAAGNQSMIAADEVFFKGRLIPMQENRSRTQKTTLRDELKNDEGGYPCLARSRPPKVPIRWKELLGLKKSPPQPKKQESFGGSWDRDKEDIHGKSSDQE